MNATQAWEAIALPRPADPGPAPEEHCFSSPDARRSYYRAGPPFGDRFGPGSLQMHEEGFNRAILEKAEVRPGQRVLVLGELLDRAGFVALIEEAVRPGGEVEYVEMMPMVEAHNVGRWAAYEEICADFADGEFDAIVATQWHHCLEPRDELERLSETVRPGGKVVLFDPGPTAATFALAERDAWLEALLGFFVTFTGSMEVPIEDAYAWKRAAWLAVSVEDVRDAAERCLVDVSTSLQRGMAIVEGRRRLAGSAGSAAR